MEIELTRARFKDAIWFKKASELCCIIGGAGSLGSFLSLMLSRINMQIILYDNDTYENHNLGGQFCTINSIGMSKVFSTKGLIKEFSDKTIMVQEKLYNEDSGVHNIMFACFDSIKARKLMFDKWKGYVDTLDKDSEDYKLAIFFDLRCTPDVVQVITITPDKVDRYKEFVFDDSEVESLPCTYKQTTHCATLITSVATSIFTNHLTNFLQGQIVSPIPVFWEYILNINELNIK